MNRTKNTDEQLDDVAETLRESVEHIQGSVKPLVEEWMQKGKKMAKQAVDTAQETGEKVRQKTHEALDEYGEYVSSQPLKSVLIAAGVGAVIASFILTLQRGK